MDKYKRYYGVALFVTAVVLLVYGAYNLINPKLLRSEELTSQIAEKQSQLEAKQREKVIVENKIKKMKDSLLHSQKKLYSPIESDLGNETLFFTLYNDVIEMIHANSVKIKSINYVYNPKEDPFVSFSKEKYFVSDIDLELVSNYTNLGKLVQDLYQYPYYIKINQLDVKPFAKDKKILISKLSLRLYANTTPKDENEIE